MAHTAEERDHLTTPLCGAKKKNGQRCRAFAGQGTDHRGIGKCKYHGGSTTTHRQHAVTVEAQRRMVTLGEPLDIRPHEALLAILRATAGHVAWLNVEITSLDGLADPEARVVTALYAEERDRLTRISRACLDSGVSDLEVKVNKQQSEWLAKAIESAINSVGGLSKDQRRQFGQVFRLELQQIQASATEPAS